MFAQGTVKETVGNVNLPIVCAGQLINPGDLIVADDDGVVVVRRREAADVLNLSREREEKEAKSRTRYLRGELSLDVNNMRAKLAEQKGAKRRFIWTDGVFSMEGAIAKLPDILQIARDTNSIIVMDDSHSTGVLGKTGRGTAEHFGVLGEVDVIT